MEDVLGYEGKRVVVTAKALADRGEIMLAEGGSDDELIY